MRLLELLKRFVGSDQSTISNAAYQRKRQREIERLEQKYDLLTVEGINSIPVPRRKAFSSNESVTGKIEYYLLLKGGQYEKSGESELAIACYRKANELMPMSSTFYQRDSYMRLPRYLRKLRRFDEARVEEQKLERMFPGGSKLSAKDEAVLRANRDGSARDTDLVEVSWVSGCCETCGKYRGRIFSLTGRDRRFPRFPSDFCEKCGLTYFPFYGISEPQFTKKQGAALIREMSKPFVDTRTAQDLRNYKEILDTLKAEEVKMINSADYDWLWEFMPELCPKSLSGYVRMKNANTVNYQKIVAEARKRGRIIK